MADRMLFLALAVAIAGLLLISYISPSINPPVSKASAVTASSLEKVLRVEGKVSRAYRFKGGSMLLTITDDGGSLDAFVPYKAASKLDPKALEGRTVELTGTVRLYKGNLELQMDEISVK